MPTLTKSKRREAIAHEMRNERIVTAGVRDAARYQRILERSVLADLQAGRPPRVGDYFARFIETLQDAMVYAYLRGIERTYKAAAPYLGLSLSIYDSALDAQAKRMSITKDDVGKLRGIYGTKAANTMTAASTVVQERIDLTMQEIVEKQMLRREAIPLMRNRLRTLGIGPQKTALLETYYRTGVQTAYQAGRWQSAQDPDIKSILWGYEYSTVGDERVRDEHAALEAVKLPQDDPFWASWFPPNGWNCRCTVIEIFDKESVSKAPPSGFADDLDKNFAINPGFVEAGLINVAQDAVQATKAVQTVTVMTASETRSRAQQLYQSISYEEEQTLGNYMGVGYIEINDTLRETAGQLGYITDKTLKADIRNLDAILHKAPALDRELWFYRGLDDSVDVIFPNLEIGDRLLDHGFVSSSANPEVAQSFAGPEGFVMKIKAPANTKGAVIGEDVSEFLFPRANDPYGHRTSFLVTDIDREARQITVEVVQ